MVKVAPSILAADFVNLERDIRILKPSGADYVHVDVMDGTFVPNISIGIPVVKAIHRVADLPLDVHLMIHNPIRYVPQFCQAGANILTVHYEADTPQVIRQTLEEIAAHGVRPGLSLKPGTPAEAVLDLLELCSLVLVMTVEPGFGGQRFMPDMLPKLRTLSQALAQVNPTCELEVDGGIDPETARLCTAAGANVLVAGSSYYKAQDKAEMVRLLKG